MNLRGVDGVASEAHLDARLLADRPNLSVDRGSVLALYAHGLTAAGHHSLGHCLGLFGVHDVRVDVDPRSVHPILEDLDTRSRSPGSPTPLFYFFNQNR